MSKRNLITIVVSISLVIFFTCGQAHAQKGKPLYLAYDSEEIIRDQSKVATITSTCGLIIDGVEVLPQKMRSANTGFFKQQIVNADVMPGEHSVSVTHAPTGERVWFKPITYNFEAGHVYVVEIMVLVIRVREITKEKTIAQIAETRNNAVFERKQK